MDVRRPSWSPRTNRWIGSQKSRQPPVLTGGDSGAQFRRPTSSLYVRAALPASRCRRSTIMAGIVISTCLISGATALGDVGRQWLEKLPETVAYYEHAWNCRCLRAIDHGGAASWVAPAVLDNASTVVLKIGVPHRESRCEAVALRAIGGDGAVRLLASSDDGYAMLIEHCVPGHDLRSVTDAEADAIACGILRRIWIRSPGSEYDTVAETFDRWIEEAPDIVSRQHFDPVMVDRALEFGRDLVATQPEHVLLHGDFHPGNVLSANREPWLAIDPKPLVGEPAFDIAQWLANRRPSAMQTQYPIGALHRTVTRIASGCGLDPRRIAGWAFVKSLGWEWGPQVMSVFEELLQTF